MVTITSLNNEKIKFVRKLNRKKYRNEFRQYILEGFKLIEGAIESNQQLNSAFISFSKVDNCIDLIKS